MLKVCQEACGEACRDRPQFEARIAELLDAVLLDPEPIVNAEVTVLIADLRCFTALAETLSPQQTIGLLNRYFAAMSEQVADHGGTIDKFMGDAVMALFGAESQRDDDLRRAIVCAVAMQQAMQRLNATLERAGEPTIYAGIAISTGAAMIGGFGSAVHHEYTAVGDPVNLAARIEAYSLRGQVLLSEASREAARDFIEVGRINEVIPKGKAAPIRLYELRAVTSPRRLVVPDVEPRRSPRIRTDIPLSFRRVEDKKILFEDLEGHVQDLGYNGLSADLPIELPPYTEIVLSLRPNTLEYVAGNVYARVLRTRPIKGRFRTSLEFTSIGTPAQRAIKHYVDDKLWGR